MTKPIQRWLLSPLFIAEKRNGDTTKRKKNELTSLEHQSVTSVSAKAGLCRALDLLLKNMVEVYLDAEKIHWYLKLNQPERDSCGMARQMCEKILASMTLVARLECQFTMPCSSSTSRA